MITEKRRAPREDSDVRISMMIDGHEISAGLRNISKVGAFVEIDSDHCSGVSDEDTGKAVSLFLESGNSKARYRGTVCRYVEDGQTRFLAINFNRLI